MCDESEGATDHQGPDEKVTALSPVLPRSPLASEHESEFPEAGTPEGSVLDADEHPGLPQGLGEPTVEPPDSPDREED
jgi:hypothetical protein